MNESAVIADLDSTTLPAERRGIPDWLWPLLALVVLASASAAFSPTFHKPENLLNLLLQNSFIGIVALGMTFVIISGGIDLSVGALVALSGIAGIWMMNTVINAPAIMTATDLARRIGIDPSDPALRIALARMMIRLRLAGSEGWGVLLCVVATLIVGFAGGLLNGAIIAKGRLAPFIATLATLAMYRSLAQSVAEGGELRSASPRLFAHIGAGGIPLFGLQVARGVPLILPYPVLVVVILAIASSILLGRFRYGRYVHALGCNERSAIYSAINVDRVKWVTYTLSGTLCGVAGLMLSSRLNSFSSSSAGVLYELDAIAAVAIGGTRMRGGSGTILGTIIGVLILGIISNMLTLLDVSPYFQGVVKGLIIIAAVLVQRTAGRRA